MCVKIKLKDGKVLAGNGRLTDEEIDQLQQYYGLTIRQHLISVEAMKKVIWETYFHKLSSDDEPQHQLCPTHSDTCYKHNKGQQKCEKYTFTIRYHRQLWML